MYPSLHVPALNVTVPSYLVCLLLAFVVSAVLGYRGAIRVEGLDPRKTQKALLVVAAATLVGGHVHFVLANIASLPGHTASVLLSPSMHAPGAIMGVVVGLITADRYVPVWRLADGLAP